MRNVANRLLLALAFPLFLALAACGSTSPGIFAQAQQSVQQAEQASLPRTRVKTLSELVVATKNGLAEEFTAKRLAAADFIATEPMEKQARDSLNEAGRNLDKAESYRKLAATRATTAEKLADQASAAAFEKVALDNCDAAEAAFKAMDAVLSRVRGNVIAVPVKPAA